jgi:hypothetical protein
VAALCFTAVKCSAPPARGGEIQVATGPGAAASTWRGDGSFSQGLRLGYRFADLVAIDSVSRLGYGTVDDRVITYFSLGGTLYGRIGKVRPYIRLAFVHQHEEPLPGYREDPFGAFFGVGDGIRHRGGFGSSLGVDVPVHKGKSTELVLGVDATGSFFPDPRGPQVYAGGSLWLGLNFGI